MIPLSPVIIPQAELFRLLGRQVAQDAIDAGWIKPCAVKDSNRGPSKKIYSVEDLRRVEQRIKDGEYPTNK